MEETTSQNVSQLAGTSDDGVYQRAGLLTAFHKTVPTILAFRLSTIIWNNDWTIQNHLARTSNPITFGKIPD